MADADLTYDFDEIPRFVAELQGGAELVMGDRMDNIHPGAMPWLHRYVGNRSSPASSTSSSAPASRTHTAACAGFPPATFPWSAFARPAWGLPPGLVSPPPKEAPTTPR